MNKHPTQALNQQIRASEYGKTIPIDYRGLYQSVMQGKASPRQVIKARCQQCVAYEQVVERVRECRSYICPNWLMRPYQEKRNAVNEPNPSDGGCQ